MLSKDRLFSDDLKIFFKAGAALTLCQNIRFCSEIVGLRELATHSSHEYYSILMETSMPTMTAVAMVNVSSMSPPFGPILPSSTKV